MTDGRKDQMPKFVKLMTVLLLALVAGGAFTCDALADDLAPQQIVDAFQKDYPKIEFQRIYVSPVPGLYEVITGNRILYFSPETSDILVGDMWTKDGENLTKARIGKIMGERLKDLPIDKAIKIGSGKNIVVEVTDPDCPYCRKAAEFFATRTDTTRYVFLMALSMHPNAQEKARFILSSPDPAQTYEDVMAGRYDDVPLPEFKDNGVFEIHKAATDMLGLTGTPNFWINGTYIAGANFKAIENLLN